jgi:DnaK suppressor protein
MQDRETISGMLKGRLAELGAKVDEIEGDLRTPHSTGWEDRATEIEGDEVLGALEETAIAEIMQIREALKRLEDGTYGTCQMCGSMINPKRLEALPYAAECIECAEAD